MRFVLLTVTITFVLVALPAHAGAATNTWTGAVSDYWGEAGNWSLGEVPDETDDAVIEGDNVLVASTASARSLTVRGSASAGAIVTVSSTLTLGPELGGGPTEIVFDGTQQFARIELQGGVLDASDGHLDAASTGSVPGQLRLQGTPFGSGTSQVSLLDVHVSQTASTTLPTTLATFTFEAQEVTELAWSPGANATLGASTTIIVRGSGATFHVPQTATAVQPDITLDGGRLAADQNGSTVKTLAGTFTPDGTVDVGVGTTLVVPDPNPQWMDQLNGELVGGTWDLDDGAVVRIPTDDDRIAVVNGATVLLRRPSARFEDPDSPGGNLLFQAGQTLFVDNGRLQFSVPASPYAWDSLPAGAGITSFASTIAVNGIVDIPGNVTLDATSELRVARNASLGARLDVGGTLTTHADTDLVLDTTGAMPAYPSSATVATAVTRGAAARFGMPTATPALAAPWSYAVDDAGTTIAARLTETGAPVNPTGADDGTHALNTPTTDTTIDVTPSGASDAHSGLAGYAIVLDQVAATTPGTTVTHTGPTATLTAPGTGSWYVHVRAIDTVGNAGPSGTVLHLGPYVVDVTAPAEPTITGSVANDAATTATTATIGVAAEPGATLSCRVDGVIVANCESGIALTGLALGSHVVDAVATDAAGNESPRARLGWTVSVAPAEPTPSADPPVAPHPRLVRVLGSLRIALQARRGALVVIAPFDGPRVTVTARIVVTARQARALGMRLRRGQRTVVLGTGVTTTAAAGRSNVRIAYTRAARTAFAHASTRRPPVAKVVATVQLQLTRDARSSSVARIVTFVR